MGWESIDWINLSQDKEKKRSLVNKVKAFRIPFMQAIPWLGTVGFSKRTLLHAVGYTEIRTHPDEFRPLT